MANYVDLMQFVIYGHILYICTATENTFSVQVKFIIIYLAHDF